MGKITNPGACSSDHIGYSTRVITSETLVLKVISLASAAQLGLHRDKYSTSGLLVITSSCSIIVAMSRAATQHAC